MVTTTSSKDEQTPLLDVHLKVALVPAGTPVTDVLGFDGDVIVPVPLTSVHTPGIGIRDIKEIFTSSIKLPTELLLVAVDRASNWKRVTV